MSQQTIKQEARRAAREVAGKRRKEREERERRLVDLAEQVMVAIGQRDAAVAETERRAGEALRELTEIEGLSLGEAVEWCGETVTVREAARLRMLSNADGEPSGASGEPNGDASDGSGNDGAAPASAGSGGADAGTSAR
jgi:hypothetical protein